MTILKYIWTKFPPLNVTFNSRDALATTLSALYGKLLVVMGTAFPMAEVISTYIPPSFYEIYYLYLYIGSMFFLLYMYMVLIRDKRRRKKEEGKSKCAGVLHGNAIGIWWVKFLRNEAVSWFVTKNRKNKIDFPSSIEVIFPSEAT